MIFSDVTKLLLLGMAMGASTVGAGIYIYCLRKENDDLRTRRS